MDPDSPDGMRDELRAAWHRYVDVLAPLRPDLHRYCRRLTGNVWDAEDLVQDTLLRAFAQLGLIHHAIRDPRAYLLRTASHAFIDRVRRAQAEARALAAADEPLRPAAADRSAAARDAAEALFEQLPPRERAAVVLKDAFDLSLEEIARILGTSVGAVKAALHRGRGRLATAETPDMTVKRRSCAPELVDRFLAAYHAGSVEGLVALMQEGGTAENVGCGLGIGPDDFEGKDHFLYKAVHGHPEWPAALQPEAVRVVRGELDGEPLILCFATRRGREALEQILRLDEEDGRIARLRGYAFCPETMREVAARLGLEVRTGLYRYPTAAPGVAYTA